MLSRISYSQMRYLIIIIWILLFLFLFLFPVVKTNFEQYDKSTITIGLRLHEFDKNSNIKLALEPWQEQYLIGQNIPLPVLSLEYINVPTELLPEGDQVCIDEIKITGTFGATENVRYQIPNSDQKTCFSAGKNVILSNDFQISPFLYEDFSNPFLYPFDTRKIIFDISTNLSLTPSGDKIKDEPVIRVSPDPPRWIANTSEISSSLGETTSYETTLHRYPSTRGLSILVPITILLIILLILPKITEIGSLWEVTIGLILGLWGLHQVLIPEYIDYPTIMENIILLLFVTLALFVLHIIFIQRKKASEPSSVDALASEIPVEKK